MVSFWRKFRRALSMFIFPKSDIRITHTPRVLDMYHRQFPED